MYRQNVSSIHKIYFVQDFKLTFPSVYNQCFVLDYFSYCWCENFILIYLDQYHLNYLYSLELCLNQLLSRLKFYYDSYFQHYPNYYN